MIKVHNMTSARTGKEVANQFVVHVDNTITFQSYNSTIITIDFDNKTIQVYSEYDYSRTTAKYRNQFLSDYFYSISNKKSFEKALQAGEIDGFKIVKMWVV